MNTKTSMWYAANLLIVAVAEAHWKLQTVDLDDKSKDTSLVPKIWIAFRAEKRQKMQFFSLFWMWISRHCSNEKQYVML